MDNLAVNELRNTRGMFNMTFTYRKTRWMEVGAIVEGNCGYKVGSYSG